MKAKDLAYALETSVRSIYRDVDTLAEAGIPIVTTTGPSGGIELMEGYTVNLKQLNGEDVINLYLTGMGIYSEGKSESGLKLQNALLKLEKTLPASYQSDIRKVRSRFYFDDTPWWSERITNPCLETLRTAVWRSQKLHIQYHKTHGVCSSRHIQPYGLVVKKADWYVIAFCEDAKEIRTFKCERVVEAKLTGETFETPPDFSLETFWNRREAEFKQSCRENEFFPVVIRLDESKGNVLKQYEVIQSRQEGNQLLVTINMFGFDIACRDVLALIGKVEFVEPEELRHYVKEKLLELQKWYES